MNEKNHALLATSPDKFMPQYGSLCANGTVFTIPLDGKRDALTIVDQRFPKRGGGR